MGLVELPERSSGGRGSDFRSGTRFIAVADEAVVKHRLHLGVVADVPSIERLVECTASGKHILHVGDVADVPSIERLVEFFASIKHTIHVGHVADVPSIERLVKSYAT